MTTTLTHSGLDEIVLHADIPPEDLKAGARAEVRSDSLGRHPNRFRGAKKRLTDRQAGEKRRADA